MNSPLSPSGISPAASKFACVSCFERKVKCDKRNPCTACIKHRVQCVFRPTKPTRKKRRTAEQALLNERLKRYEALLQDKGINPNIEPDKIEAEDHDKSDQPEAAETVWQLPTPAPSLSGPQETIFKPKLVQGQSDSKFIDNSLWSRVLEEIHDAEETNEGDSANESDDDAPSNGPYDHILHVQPRTAALSHPPTGVIIRLWLIFVDRVDPLTKIVHAPSLQSAIEKSILNITQIPKPFEALMFAIYSMAIISLTEDESQAELGETRAVLLARYVAATKAALSRARFMSSTSIVVLQALVLHILSIRDDEEPRAVWSLTGCAIRIAEGMGMGLDGTLLGRSPFETEIYRRIWWQLKMQDFRAAELACQAKFRHFELDETTPKKPANISDCDLSPAMPHALEESTKPTEMIWVMCRTEMASFAATQKVKMQRLGKTLSTSDEYSAMDQLAVKDGFIKQLEDVMETKYIRFCDPTNPLQLMTVLGARMALNLIKFIAHHPRRWVNGQVSASEQTFVWDRVIQLLEQYNMIQSSPQLRCFAWNATYFLQWHAVIHVLDTLRAEPLHQDALKAWRLIDGLYESNSAMLLNVKKPISVAVGHLCLKASNARAAAVVKEGNIPYQPPSYILKLQEQRDAAKARKASMMARRKEQENVNGRGAEAVQTNAEANAGFDTSLVFQSTPLSSNINSQPTQPAQQSKPLGDDAFWLTDAFNNDPLLAGEAGGDSMDVDMDAILGQDSSPDTANDGIIDWAQWDAWLAGVDAGRIGGGA